MKRFPPCWMSPGVLAGMACFGAMLLNIQIRAQELPPEPQPSEAPAEIVLPPSDRPSTPAERPVNHATRNGQPGITRANDGLVLNFRDANIEVVLEELSSVAGFIIVKEVRPQGRVSLTSRQPVSPEEAVSLLNTVLHNAGYAAIQQDRILKIVSRDVAKRLNIPVRSGSDPDKIAATDELITQVIPLRYADAAELRQDLQPLINPNADFTANASANALVITDTSANVRRVVQIINALDTSLADAVEVRVFQLRYANAASAARLINDIFSNLNVAQPDQQATDPAARWRAFQQQMMQQLQPAQQQRGTPTQQQQQRGQQRAQQGARGARVTASADDRTNSVVVAGPTDTLASVAAIIRELDSNPVAEETVFVYRLRNAQALNVEAVVNTLFGNPTTATRGTQQQSLRGGTTGTQRSTRTTGGTTGIGTGTTGVGSGTGTQTGGRLAQAQQTQQTTAGTGAARVSAAAAQTASDLAGQVTIIADPDTNSLLVRTAPANYERVRAILDELDRPVAQVLIKVLIAEVTHDDGLDLGAEFSVLNIRASGLGQQGRTNFNIPTQGSNATGLVVQILESDFTATIRALETAGKLDVLSRPYILASDNQLASITVGQEIPFITSSRLTETGQTINNYVYGDVGILLDVIPHINPDGLVILDVAPEISALTGVTVPISPGVDVPVIAKRSAQTRVGVRNSQTVVIGGLMEDRKTQSVAKVPLLGDIPLAGALFRRTQTNKAKTELLIFLTPHVAFDPDAVESMGREELDSAKLVPQAVAPGKFDEHHQGLQRGNPGGVEAESND